MISKSANEGNTTTVKKTKTAGTPIVIQRVNNSPGTKILQPETFPKDTIAENKPDTKIPETAITSTNLIKSTKGTKTGIYVTNTGRNIKECNRICCTGNIVLRGLPVKSRDECDPNDIGLHFDIISITYTDSKKYELLKNTWKPPPGYIYPQHVESGRHWRINSTYLCETSKFYYSWLCYSAYFDGAFCLPYVVFAHQYGKCNLKKIFKESFTRWNGAPSRWSEHNDSEIHRYFASAMQTFLGQMEGNRKRIDEIVAVKGSRKIVKR